MNGKKIKIPEKRSINLAMHERRMKNPAASIPVILIILAAAFLFGKFAVADRVAAITRANEMLQETQSRVQALNTQAAEFSQLQKEYAKYSTNWMADEEKAVVDRQQIIALIQEEIIPSALIERYSVVNNQLSIDLSGVSLDATALLVSRLEHRDEVASVEVYTANTQVSASGTSVSLILKLHNEEGIQQAKMRTEAEASAEGGQR